MSDKEIDALVERLEAEASIPGTSPASIDTVREAAQLIKERRNHVDHELYATVLRQRNDAIARAEKAEKEEAISHRANKALVEQNCRLVAERDEWKNRYEAATRNHSHD